MRFAAILFGLVLSQIASGTQAQAGGAQTQNTACPYYVLLSNNIQTYIKVYSQSLLNELAAGKQLSDKPHTVSVKEILGPVYNYMASSAWPQGMTMAVSKLMSGPDEDIATCFPRLELVRINLQQYFDRKGQQGALVVRYEKPLAETLREEHKAAEEGSASAQIHLGNMYFNGQGVPKDHQQAITLWRKAAEQGAAEAQYNLGYAYRHGLRSAAGLSASSHLV